MVESPVQRIAVVGAGAWGTALALVARRTGRAVKIAARKSDVADAINHRHENPLFLPGVHLDTAIEATTDAGATVAWADAVLLAVPAQYLRGVATAIAPMLRDQTPVIICAKGIECGTGAMMSDVVASVLPACRIAVLSGPTFAAEVARGLPTAVTLACTDSGLATRLIDALGGPTFRPYQSSDVIGVQIGGAVKNVIAIACGIVVGRKLGENARAAVMTRGLAEIMRLGVAMGARRETLMGLSGLGDLSLTCASAQSRNMSLGIALGEGRSLADALAGKRSVAEGADSATSVRALARQRGVDMPIVEAVDTILHEGAAIDATIAALLARPFRSEEEGGA